MLSREFRNAVDGGNLLRARIMLKDSLLGDLSFSQFDEMLRYARQRLDKLIVPYDGEFLENDTSKWNTDLMNTELVEIVNNFSPERIAHLKEVIGVVLASNSKKTPIASPPIGNQSRSSSTNPSYIEEPKDEARMQQALSKITGNSKEIEGIMKSIQDKGAWDLSDVQKLKEAARQIESAAKEYEKIISRRSISWL